MRNPREHTLNHSACLIHTGNDDDHFPLDGPDGLSRHNVAVPAVRGGMVLVAAAGIELDDPLKLMDSNGPETLGKVSRLQAHAMTVHGICHA
jgi:hypothetical protein